MSTSLLVDLIKAFLATLVSEELIALFWKERSLRLALCILWVNAITNPVANILVLLAPIDWIESNARYYSLLIVVELAVCITETCLFSRIGRIAPKSRAFLFSLTLNAVSCSAAYPLEVIGFWK